MKRIDLLNIQPIYLRKYTSVGIEWVLNYNTSKILDKSFNIFELKELIGQDNVLLTLAKTILEAFGFYSDDKSNSSSNPIVWGSILFVAFTLFF